jgi:hypothetical protein
VEKARFESVSVLQARRLKLYAVALTSEPDERLLRKLSSALCAVLTLPELSADPICESKLENDVLLEVLEELFKLLDVLLDEELSVELSRLVSES